MNIQINKHAKVPIKDQIYQEIAERIRSRILNPGQPLPSIRKLAEQLNVSQVTVHKAYEKLAKDRLIVKVHGKGVFVKLSNEGQVRETHARDGYEWQYNVSDYIHRAQLIQYLYQAKPIQFATSVIYPKLLPTNLMKEEMIRLVSEDPSVLTRYSEAQGDLELRIGMQKFLKEYHGIDATAEQLIITSGSQQAIDMVAKSFIGPGDIVLMENPCYTGAIDVMRSRGASIIPIELDDDGIKTSDLYVLCEKLRPKLIYTNPSFQNPTGTVLSEKRRKELVEIAKMFNILILEDDAVSEIYFDQTPPPKPIAYWDTNGHVIYIKGLTKTLSPGCRIAAVRASGMIFEKLIASKVSSDIASPLLTQKAVLAFIQSKRLADHYEKLRIALEVRRDRIMATFKDRLGDHIHFQRPHGGLNLWIQLPDKIDTEELLVKGLAQNVSFLPGTACYLSPFNKHYLRLSYSAVSDHDLDEGVDRLVKLILNEL